MFEASFLFSDGFTLKFWYESTPPPPTSRCASDIKPKLMLMRSCCISAVDVHRLSISGKRFQPSMPCCGCMCIQNAWDSSFTLPALSCSLSRLKTRCSLILLWFPEPYWVFHQLHLQCLQKNFQQLHGICPVNDRFVLIHWYKTWHHWSAHEDFFPFLFQANGSFRKVSTLMTFFKINDLHEFYFFFVVISDY